MFKGLLLKESLTDERILDLITITKTEVWDIEHKEDFQPDQWTALFFEGKSEQADFVADEMAKVMKPRWYANFSTEDSVYVIFEKRVFTYPKGNEVMRQMVQDYAISKGIPESQAGWSE